MAISSTQTKEVSWSLVKLEDKIFSGSSRCIMKGKLFEDETLIKHTVVAFKSVDDDTEFDKESKAAGSLNHKNILKFFGVTNSENKNATRYMVFEYMVNGDLVQWLSGEGVKFGIVPESNFINQLSLADFGHQIAKGMEYMASQKYIHRDLAGRNIFLAGDLQIKIADFGLARCIEEHGFYRMKDKRIYPVRWTAPESIESGDFNTQSDIWSFGVLLWEIFSYGKTPFDEVLDPPEIKEMVRCGYRLQIPIGCPEPMYDLMKRCWTPEPKERPSFEDIVKDIKNFLKTYVKTTPLLMKWVLWQLNPKFNKSVLNGWSIQQLSAELREIWPSLQLLSEVRHMLKDIKRLNREIKTELSNFSF